MTNRRYLKQKPKLDISKSEIRKVSDNPTFHTATYTVSGKNRAGANTVKILMKQLVQP